jgi:hypothetical protein
MVRQPELEPVPMRCFSPAIAPSAIALSLSLALPVAGQTILSEASGNWAGSSNQGFYFRAQLTQNEDKARLRIWGGALDGVPDATGEPEFDNAQIALGAFATLQELEVFEFGDGAVLQVVTEFADEEAEGRTVVQIQYLDNQYTVIGYYYQASLDTADGGSGQYECELDLHKMVSAENGKRRKLGAVSFDQLNASDWTFSAAFDRGWCSGL